MAATSAASAMMKPADAARAPEGPTKTTTGVRAAIIRDTIVRVDSRSPPGVRSTSTTTVAPLVSARVIASSTNSAAIGWMMPSYSATTARGDTSAVVPTTRGSEPPSKEAVRSAAPAVIRPTVAFYAAYILPSSAEGP